MRNLKRALSMALAAIMVLGLMVVGASAAGYEDFTDKDEIQYTEAVNTMVSLGVISGKEDGSYYDPTGSLTRAEACTLIARMLGGGKDPVLGSNITSNFTDTKGHWAETYIAYCANLGIIVGVGDGSFNPDGVLTGTAAAKMVLCALGYKPEFEGIGGANWELATNTLATKVKLYDGLEDLNPSETITRDQVAQLIYNGVQADEVEYRNLEGDYSGTLYAQPVKGVANDSTMLLIRFRVVKVTGILEANDKVSVTGDVALEERSLLNVTNVAGKQTVDYSKLMGQQSFKVTTPDEMVGQEIVLYVQFQNELAPNASQSTVIGSPIITDNNTVVETTTRLKDEAAVRSALREGGMSNVGTPVEVRYTENDVVIGGTTKGVTDSITAAVRNTENTRSAGIVQRFIDNDGNGTPDYIIQVVPVLTSVNSVNADNTKYTFTGITGTISSADIVTDLELARNDVVLVTKYADGCYYFTAPETVEGKVASYNTNNNTVAVDSTNYGNSGGKNLGVAGTTQILAENMVDNTYRFYLDTCGNVLGYIEIDTVIGNYAVVQGYSVDGNDTMSYTAKVKLLMQDGTTASYDVNLAATAVRLGLANAADSVSAKEKAAVDNGYFEKTFDPTDTALVNHVFSYSVDNGVVTLMRPQEVNGDLYRSTYIDSSNSLNTDSDLTSSSINKNTATYTTTNGNIVANDQTVFFIKDWAADNTSDYFVTVGLSNLPASNVNVGNAIDAYDAVNSTPGTDGVADAQVADTIAYKAPGSDTWVAKAIFITTNSEYKSTRDFVYITNKYVYSDATGTPKYTFDVVTKDGETIQMTTTDNANNLSETVREYYSEGSYVNFVSNGTVDNVYVKNITGNTVTLADIDTGVNVTPISSRYIASGAKIWDVQNDVVADTLQENDMVAVKWGVDGSIEAAFIYGTMNGKFAPSLANTDLKVGGQSNGGTLTADVGDKIPVEVPVPAGADSVDVSINGTKVAMSAVSRAVTMTGTYEITQADITKGKLDITTVVKQDGLDSLTQTFSITLTKGEYVEGGDNDETLNPDEAAVTDINDALKGNANEVVIEGDFNPAVYADTDALNIPAGKTLTIKGNFTGNANVIIRGTLNVEGTYKPNAAHSTFTGTVKAQTLDMTNGPVTVNGTLETASITNGKALNVASSGTVTLKGDNTLPANSKIEGTLNVDTGKTLTLNDSNLNSTNAITGTINAADATVAVKDNMKIAADGSMTVKTLTPDAEKSVNNEGTLVVTEFTGSDNNIYSTSGSSLNVAGEQLIGGTNPLFTMTDSNDSTAEFQIANDIQGYVRYSIGEGTQGSTNASAMLNRDLHLTDGGVEKLLVRHGVALKVNAGVKIIIDEDMTVELKDSSEVTNLTDGTFAGINVSSNKLTGDGDKTAVGEAATLTGLSA